jgi:hypothetical protein
MKHNYYKRALYDIVESVVFKADSCEQFSTHFARVTFFDNDRMDGDFYRGCHWSPAIYSALEMPPESHDPTLSITPK